MYGGGKGGGKSFLFALWVNWMAEELIELFGLEYASRDPLPVGFIGRKQAVDFRRTTLETFKRVIPSDNYRIREQDNEIIFYDRVKVYFGGLDDRAKINKFNSAEFAFFGLDQGEETERDDVSVLQAALRLVYKGIVPPYKQLFTANPDECWLKEDFIDNPLPNYHFVPALWSDNPHLPPNYSQTLTAAFRYNQALLDAYLNGNWYALQAENALLSAKHFAELKSVTHFWKKRKAVVVCDPSLGGDACIIKVMENYKTVEQLTLHVREPMKIAGEMMVLGTRHRIPNYAADVTGGLGEAILDRIREVKPSSNRQYLNFAAKENYFKYGVNLRAEMHWNYMMAVIDKRIPYPESEETRRQVLALRFKVANSDGMIQIELKEKTKKRLGQSPDDADTEIMGVWALDRSEPILAKDAWRGDDGSRHEIGSAVTSAMTA